MSGTKLDQIVKGAPSPGTSVPSINSKSSSPVKLSETPAYAQKRSSTPLSSSDPLAILPSSPPQIYLNLLILEASLRSQYLTLRARRRQNTFFLFLLTLWIASFTYLLFLRPREDGSGVGGSVYWVVEMAEKMALMGGLVTVILIWGTGQWERGVRWPRRWVAVANRGLRSVNAKIIVIKGPWWMEILGHLSFVFPYSSLFPSSGHSYRYRGPVSDQHILDIDEIPSQQEDLSPGGNYIRLLLLPKLFSSEFRENWEHYRLEYWEKENQRRTRLRGILRKRELESARRQRGWFWWMDLRRSRNTATIAKSNVEKNHYYKQLTEKDGKRRHSFARSDSYTRNASQSSTPSAYDPDERPVTVKARHGSITTSASERRRRGNRSGLVDQNHLMNHVPISHPA